MFFIREKIIAEECDRLNGHPVEHALSRYIHDIAKDYCLDMENIWFERYLNDSDHRMYFYQQCSGFGWVPNTSSKQQPFGTQIPLELFYQNCQSNFGERSVQCAQRS